MASALHVARALALGACGLVASAIAAPRYAFEAVTSPAGRVVDGLVGFTTSGAIAGTWRGPDGAAVAGFLRPDGGFTSVGPALPEGAGLWAADETHGFVGRLGDAAWRFGSTPGPVPGV